MLPNVASCTCAFIIAPVYKKKIQPPESDETLKRGSNNK
ncbi:hypothetical protein SLEP1_g20368 [Rubroshorea leprosula]|uniref:Uncharacterized protein n=1 Tax=Rubroshorea leprosula TaxID=152421 RepID=A0AAV5J2G6_9ROSI|nr:hypothetical protein SLEP1_g20368 [Rubroshorea leprosula]